MYTKCRLPPDFQTNNPYLGKEIEFKIPKDDGFEKEKVILDIYECVLWFFQFRQETGPISQYFGVMDIDIEREEGISDDEYRIKIQQYLPVLEDRLFQMNYHCYTIYASGTKGYHVYLYDINLWRVPTVNDPATYTLWIQQQIENMYPLMVSDLDKNIYDINKGIRNSCWPHPKTGRASRLLKSKNAPNCIWTWLCDVIFAYQPKSIDFIPISHVPAAQVSSSVPTTTEVIYSLDIAGQLKQLFKGAELTAKSEKLFLIKTKWCPIKNGDHDQTGKCYVHMYEDYALVKCHHSKCAGKSLTIKNKTDPLTDFHGLQKKLISEGEIKKSTCRLRVIDPRKQKHVLSQDIDWALSDGGLGIISAPMGAGKTTSVIQWIEEKRRSKAEKAHLQGKEVKPFKVLLLVTRITQAINFSSKYPGMKNYQDVEGSVYDYETSVLCVNSLIRAVSNTNRGIPKFGLLILDEIESLIEALISAILSQGKSKQCNIWQLFKCLIIGSKRVLFMDGILTSRTARFLDHLTVLDRCSLVQHEGQPDYREYINFRSTSIFDEHFEADCRSGKKIAIVSNSKRSLYTYAGKAAFYTQNSLIITGDSTKEEKLTASDPNEDWTRDVLAFNTAVGPGSSYDEIHFDMMYVICCPESCTPYSLYQMINRIRTLKDKKVKMYVLYSEFKNIPTKDELKRRKAENIVRMHSKQDEFVFGLDFYEKIGTNNVKLDINNISYEVMRRLIQEEKLILYYEDSHFVDTLVDYEYEKLRFNDTVYYTNTLFDIIRRNGGTVKGLTDYEVSEKQKKEMKKASTILKKEGKTVYLQRGLTCSNILTERLPPTITADQREVINRQVQLNDLDAQFRWSSFRRALTRSESTLYEKELEAINEKRKAVNNTLVYSTGLLESIKQLCEMCGLRIDSARGIVEGECSYQTFLGRHEAFDAVMRRIDVFLPTSRKLNFKVLNRSISFKNTATFNNIEMVFKEFGIRLVLDSKGSRKKISENGEDKRWVDKKFTVCLYSQYIRMAFSGLAFDTGLVVENAFEHLMNNYKKSN